jgi:methionine synthase II (cobalamin-independent)
MGAPYRADHLGSFLRPPELLQARSDPATTAERLRRAAAEALEQYGDYGPRDAP